MSQGLVMTVYISTSEYIIFQYVRCTGWINTCKVPPVYKALENAGNIEKEVRVPAAQLVLDSRKGETATHNDNLLCQELW